MTDIATFTLDKDYADLTILTEAQLDAALIDADTGSCQGFINTKIINNINQMYKDCLDTAGTEYTFDDDGAAQYTNSLYAKQNGSDSYNAADISIGTAATLAYADVDALNAALTFTPERAGDYKVTFNFTHLVQFNATTEGQCESSFRITDGTASSFSQRSGGYMPATAANNGRFVHPISITHIFTWATTAARTITLQYYNRVATAGNANQVSASAANGEVYMICEKI